MMKNVVTLLIIFTLKIVSMENKSVMMASMQQGPNDGTMLKTVCLEAGTVDKTINGTAFKLYKEYNFTVPRKLSDTEKMKLEKDEKKLLEHWNELQLEGYTFGSESELESLESSSTSAANSPALPKKDSLEATYRLINRKQLDLDSQNQDETSDEISHNS